MPSPQTQTSQTFQVTVRIKPRQSNNSSKPSVFVSKEDRQTLIVQSKTKRQYFTFDYIADQKSSQEEVYGIIGSPLLEDSIKGFNSCILAYGQTGAGKTFSILGNITQEGDRGGISDKGLLPRLLQQLFVRCDQEFSSVQINCTYLQIYNEQIIDLLQKEPKTCQIRENKQGVSVDGLKVEQVKNYSEALNLLLKGLKNRTTASTLMNSESSRSHGIFTIALKGTLDEDQQHSRVVSSKIHVVDLAGSERIKQSKVEGQRLREGCNINKSLSVLGNVVNALIQSQKKRKYIPFRDSKLTFFLKDSIGNNSKTKLLANINSQQEYLSDTISTLMFAKRAKIVKSRVEVNQVITQNFEALRSEVRKLREQLAQTRFMDGAKSTRVEPLQLTRMQFQQPSRQNPSCFRVLQQNEKQLRSVVQLQQALLNKVPEQKTAYGMKQIYQEKRSLQKKCQGLVKMVSNFPCFSTLFTNNLQLKEKLRQTEDDKTRLESEVTRLLRENCELICLVRQVKSTQSLQSAGPSTSIRVQNSTTVPPLQTRHLQMLLEYEQIIQQLKSELSECLSNLGQVYRQKMLKKKQYSQGTNEADYLRLNILDLQNQVSTLQKQAVQKEIQLKASYHQNQQLKTKLQGYDLNGNGVDIGQLEAVVSSLSGVLQQAQLEAKQFEERAESQHLQYLSLRQKYNQLVMQNIELSTGNGKTTVTSSQIRRAIGIHQSQELKQSRMTGVEQEGPNQQNIESSFKLSNYTHELDTLVSDKKSLESQVALSREKWQEGKMLLESASQKILSLTRENIGFKDQLKSVGEELMNLRASVAETTHSEKALRQKNIYLESQLRNTKKEYEVDTSLKVVIRKHTGKSVLQLFEEFKILAERNHLLNAENQKFRTGAKVQSGTTITSLKMDKIPHSPTTNPLTKYKKTSSLQKLSNDPHPVSVKKDQPKRETSYKKLLPPPPESKAFQFGSPKRK